MVVGNILEMKRKSYKEQLVALIAEHPDMPLIQVVGIMSTRTGLSHKRISVYVDELLAEGRLPAGIKELA